MGNPRRIMAAGTKHDGWIRKAEQVSVVSAQVVHELAYVGVALAGHHEADRQAGWVSSGGGKFEASEGSQRALALEVHVENDAWVVVMC